MDKRSFAGYLCEESLSVGLFGETFRGQNRKGEEARVVVVDGRLSRRKNFAVALARSAGDIAELMHPHIVTTEKVGRGKDGSLVIIASAVEGPVELPALLSRAGGHLPQDVALSIAMGALRALSHAHEHMVTHGGLHPRSVIVDGNGVTRLGDFGLALALAAVASKSGDSELLGGLRGFMAPELAVGQEPDQSSDVFAGGALVSSLLWGEPKPPVGESSALAEALRLAVDTARMRRYSNGVELEAAVRLAISTDRLEVASASRVQSYIGGLRGATEARLDAETEDLLASLDLPLSPGGAARAQSPDGLDAALAGLEDDFDEEADRETTIGASEMSPPRAKTPPVDPLAGFADDDELTAVDNDYTSIPEEDPLEAIIAQAAHPAVTAAMAPPARRKPTQEPADDYDGRDDTPLPVPRPFHADHTHALDLVELVGRQAATSSPFEESDANLPEAPRRFSAIRWLALIVFVLAALFAVAYTKTDLLKGAERDNEARTQEALEKIEKMQPKPGQISLLSDTEEAAVWLLVGRTPATSFPLPSAMVHELRIEHEGFASLFLSVGAQHWSGEDSGRKALLSASLVPNSGDQPLALPAFPPVANPPIAPGGPGQGPIRVESVPEGAQVWLLVGTTPEMSLAGIEAGRDYEFKVLKDGYRPAFAAFKAEDWYLSGSEGPMRPVLSERIRLEPLGDDAGKPGDKPGSAGAGAGAGEDASDEKAERRDRRRRRKKRKKR